jgi:hypothetical protein
MTVPVQTPVTSSVANGVTTSFPYDFKIINSADLSVTVDGELVTTGFVIAGVGEEEGGSVDFDVAPANGLKVIRFLNPVLTRVTDYQQFGDWKSDIVNNDFDRIWTAIQYLAQLGVRTIQLPVDTLAAQIIEEGPEDRAQKVIGFDLDGNVILKTSAEINPEIGEAVADAQAAAVSAEADAATATTKASEASASAAAAALSASNIDITASVLVHQNKTAFSTTGTSPTFAVVSNPLIGSYAANERMRIKFNGNVAAVACTLNRDTLGAKAIKQYDSTGAKVDPIIFASVPYDLEYDGTDYIILNPSVPSYSVLNLTGGQLKFPATQNPSSDPNTIDDYEEGTFTAVDASGAGLTFTPTLLSYTKVGKIVHVSGKINWPTTANASAAAVTLTGLPANVDANVQHLSGLISSSTGVKLILSGSTSFTLLPATVAMAQLTNANLSNQYISLNGAYVASN